MPTQNVNLSDKQAEFIRQSIDEGRFQDPSEVVGAGLLLLQQHEEQNKRKLEALGRQAVEAFEEIDRGQFEVVEADMLDQFIAKVDANARASKS